MSRPTRVAPLPRWVEEFCARLVANDDEFTRLVVPQQGGIPVPVPVTEPMMEALVAALLQNDKLQMCCMSGCLSKNPWVVRSLIEKVLPTTPPRQPQLEPVVSPLRLQPSPKSGCCSKLTTLSLSSNKLEDRHAVLIGKTLLKNTTITELYLSSNRIGDEGAAAISAGIHAKLPLKILALSWNEIGEPGCQALASRLRRNATIVRIDLLGNAVTEKGAIALEAALEHCNCTLEELWLNSNWQVKSEQKEGIAQHCQGNRRTKKAFKQLKEEKPSEIPLGLWPEALAHVSQKPDLLFGMLQVKPRLWREVGIRPDARTRKDPPPPTPAAATATATNESNKSESKPPLKKTFKATDC